uniref:Uncharacterized protein n=1 Tax=Ramularia collo-cygni TaxID=112498 RepID=A0A2D3V599_9PEZI
MCSKTTTFEECPGCCCSDFFNLPNPHDDLSWGFNLTNPILSIFARGKFYDIKDGKFSPLAPATYDKLAPALRLASRMLSDDRATHYIYTMHDGILHDGSEELEWPEIDAAEPAFDEADILRLPQRHLTRLPQRVLPPAEDMRKRSAEILENIARVLACIVFVENDLPGKSTSLTSKHQFGQLDETARQIFPRAMAAKIELSARHTQINVDEPSSTSQYILARYLVHEMGHVINKVGNGHRQYEVFYQDSCTSEGGFELEVALFSGVCEQWDLEICTSLIGKPTPVMLTEHWPSPRTYNQYAGKPYDFLRREETPEYLLISRLPPSFLKELCDDAFWDERQQRAMAASVLTTKSIVPNDLSMWTVRVGQDGRIDFFLPSEDPDTLPPSVLETFAEIQDMKQERIARKQKAAEEQEARRVEREILAEQSPKLAGEWSGEEPPSAEIPRCGKSL